MSIMGMIRLDDWLICRAAKYVCTSKKYFLTICYCLLSDKKIWQFAVCNLILQKKYFFLFFFQHHWDRADSFHDYFFHQQNVLFKSTFLMLIARRLNYKSDLNLWQEHSDVLMCPTSDCWHKLTNLAEQ